MGMFLVTLHRSGPEWMPGLPAEEQKGWADHAAFMDSLVQQRVVALGGPLGDEHRVVLAVEAGSADDVSTYLARDPWHESHLVIQSIDEWTIRLRTDAWEQIYVEHSRHSGPREGLADVDGAVHYFKGVLDCGLDGSLDEFLVWPASPEAVALEREQWSIFVEWEQSGEGRDSHPGNGGVDARYDELNTLCAPHRVPPHDARRLFAEVRWNFQEPRYTVDGIDEDIRWHSHR